MAPTALTLFCFCNPSNEILPFVTQLVIFREVNYHSRGGKSNIHLPSPKTRKTRNALLPGYWTLSGTTLANPCSSGMPLALASALRKLQRGSEARTMNIPKKRLEPVSHLFIVNPLRGDGMARLFSTHPPLEERVKRLEAMESNRGPRLIR